MIRESMANRAKRPRTRRITADLMADILSLLPSKSLHRFESVSRQWASVISKRRILLPMCGLYLDYFQSGAAADPFDYFFQAAGGGAPHFPHHGHFNPGEGEEEEEEQEEEELPPPFRAFASIETEHVEVCRHFDYCFPTDEASPHLLAACNGLFLFESDPGEYQVCNPATAEIVLLPKATYSFHSLQRSPNSYLAYDPRISPHYKVMRFALESQKFMALGMYSSLTREWNEHTVPLPQAMHRMRWSLSGSAYINGRLYLLTPESPHLLMFDVKRMQFKLQILPRILITEEERGRYPHLSCIGVSRGRLYYAAIDYFRPEMKIFMLEKEGNGVKLCHHHTMTAETFSRHLVVYHPSGVDVEVRPLAFHPDSEVVYFGVHDKVFSYHPSSERFEEVWSLAEYKKTISSMSTFVVTHSLASIDPPGSDFFRW